MSRIRSIHPGLFTDEAFVSLSPMARIFLMGIWTECDDIGLFEWSPLKLKMRLPPADSADPVALFAEIEAENCIISYEVAGKSYGAVRNFCQFQRPKKPNTVHPQTAEVLAFVNIEARSIRDGSPPVPHELPTNGEKSRLMEDGGGIKIEPNGSCASGELPEAPDEGETLKPEHIRDKWNELAGRLGKPKVRDLTPERRQLLKARIAQYDIDDFVSVFGKVERSPFLRGDTGWQRCTFDWIFKKANFQKALEGNYDH